MDGSPSTASVWASRRSTTRAAMRRVGQGEDLGGEQRRVLGVADGHGRDRDPARHLDDREQRVEAAEVLGRDGHADHRQRRLGGEHARQVGRAAGAGDDHPDPAARRRLRVAEQVVRRPMGGHDPHLARDAQLLERHRRLLEAREVRAAAADDADDGRFVGHVRRSQPSWPRAVAGTIQRRIEVVPDHRHVAHLAPLEHASLAVEVDVDVGVGERLVEPREPRRPVLARAEQVDHRRGPVRPDRAERQPEDRAQVLLELGRHGARRSSSDRSCAPAARAR